MSYRFKCPYCFTEIEDHQVHFRSELVNQGECDIIPDDYDDIHDFIRRYNGTDKEDILAEYRDWEFFAETEDEKYQNFWKDSGGTTEYNMSDDIDKVKAYHRRIIDPFLPEHQKYLKMQENGDYLIRDINGMVSQIELVSGKKCYRRVCPSCHNPLPDNYGINPVKFVSIIGTTGAGKTVFISQLLKKMSLYCAKVGLTAIVTSTSVRNFLKKNEIEAGKGLPGSTPKNQFQQPLFFDMVREAGQNNIKTETFVLYDVAGEVFKDSEAHDAIQFAPYIKHSDGMLLLIDPMQIDAFLGVTGGAKKVAEPQEVMNTIYNLVPKRMNEKYHIPIAVCISKADTSEVQSVLQPDIKSAILSEIQGISDGNGNFRTVFNAQSYAPICKELNAFMSSAGDTMTFHSNMKTQYSKFSYFAFTSLGCPVEERVSESGETYQCPVGPLLPKRLEEPLLWLFYQLGYIGKSAPLPGEIICPNCDSPNNKELLEDEREVNVIEKGFLRKKTVKKIVDRYCINCNLKWNMCDDSIRVWEDRT